MKGFLHKLLNIGFINPGSAEAHFNFRSVQVFRLCGAKRFHIGLIGFRGDQRGIFRSTEFFTHIPGEVFVSGNILVLRKGDKENNPLQILYQFFHIFAGEF